MLRIIGAPNVTSSFREFSQLFPPVWRRADPIRPMLEAFSKTLTCGRSAGARGTVAFYGPDGLTVYRILAMLLQACSKAILMHAGPL